MLFSEYARTVAATDRLPVDDLRPILFGLFGEVGSILAIAKKLRREDDAYAEYDHAVVEEFGDALWYLAALSERLDISLDTVFSTATSGHNYIEALTVTDSAGWPIALARRLSESLEIYPTLLQLGECTAALMTLTIESPDREIRLARFAELYLRALHAAKLTFRKVIEYNVAKTTGRFLRADVSALPTFDSRFDEEERLPQEFEIVFTQRKSGRSYLQWNGVFLGDPLTDNILDKDGYRFHDVFHCAHAAVLHWSPTFRALIKHKRKSNPEVDEAQDGGRAIVVEEGLTAWIFSRAKQRDYFEHGSKGISFDILKTIQDFVRGYEVDQCPLSLWEDAILQGFAAFRRIRDGNGGVVVGDRKSRKIAYRSMRTML